MCAEKNSPYTPWSYYTKRMQMWGGPVHGFGVRQLAAAFAQASLLAAHWGPYLKGASKLAPGESGSKLPHSKAPIAPFLRYDRAANGHSRFLAVRARKAIKPRMIVPKA